MSTDKSTVKVVIYDTEYPIKDVSDSKYVKEVAEYVDRKMKEIDRTMSVKVGVKIAVLAALNIADELFQARIANDKLSQEIFDRSTAMSQKIEGVIQDL